MSWGLILSVLTIAVSFLTEQVGEINSKSKGGGDSGKAVTATAAAGGRGGASQLSLLKSDYHFFAGVLLGSGLSLLWVSLSRHFRVGERCKLVWLNIKWSVFEGKLSNNRRRPYRQPKSLLQDGDDSIASLNSSDPAAAAAAPEPNNNCLQDNQDGSIRILVSPQTAATYHLGVSLIALQVGRELPMIQTRSTEFFHVVSGSGLLFSSSKPETTTSPTKTQRLHAGDCFIVDPFHWRWISNPLAESSSTASCPSPYHPIAQPLVLLRASDDRCGHPVQEKIQMDPRYRRRHNDSRSKSFTDSLLEYFTVTSSSSGTNGSSHNNTNSYSGTASIPNMDTLRSSLSKFEGYVKEKVVGDSSTEFV